MGESTAVRPSVKAPNSIAPRSHSSPASHRLPAVGSSLSAHASPKGAAPFLRAPPPFVKRRRGARAGG